MPPKISVIVPVYNGEKYLRQCLDSIVTQTHRHLEIILVNDGSTDSSGGICGEYAARDDRIRVLHQENRGQSAARNTGLDTMTGEYVSFVDADDFIAPEMLEKLLTAMETGADVSLCNIRRVSEDGSPEGVCPIGDGRLPRQEFLRKLLAEQAWFYVSPVNKLYRKRIFEKLRFPEGFIYEDEAIIYPVAARCETIVTLSEALYYYRRVPDSTMGQGFRIQTTDKLYALAQRVILCREMGWAEAFKANAARYVHTFFDYYFHFPRSGKTERYFARMEQGLKRALPHLWRAKNVTFAHKIYLTLIRIHPKLYLFLRKLKRGGNT